MTVSPSYQASRPRPPYMPPAAHRTPGIMLDDAAVKISPRSRNKVLAQDQTGYHSLNTQVKAYGFRRINHDNLCPSLTSVSRYLYGIVRRYRSLNAGIRSGCGPDPLKTARDHQSLLKEIKVYAPGLLPLVDNQ